MPEPERMAEWVQDWLPDPDPVDSLRGASKVSSIQSVLANRKEFEPDSFRVTPMLDAIQEGGGALAAANPGRMNPAVASGAPQPKKRWSSCGVGSVVTVEEAERERVDWFRLGWEEHARLAAGDHGDDDRTGPRLRLAEHGDAPGEAIGDSPDEDAHDRADDAARSDRGGRAEGERLDGEEHAGHGGRDENGSRDEFPLPVVGAAEAEVRELMPHRLRSRGRHRP